MPPHPRLPTPTSPPSRRGSNASPWRYPWCRRRSGATPWPSRHGSNAPPWRYPWCRHRSGATPWPASPRQRPRCRHRGAAIPPSCPVAPRLSMAPGGRRRARRSTSGRQCHRASRRAYCAGLQCHGLGRKQQRSPPQAAHHSHRRRQRMVHRSWERTQHCTLPNRRPRVSAAPRASLAPTTRICYARSRNKRNLSLCVTPATTPAGHHLLPLRRLPALNAHSTTPRIPFLSTSITISKLTAISSTIRPLRFHPRGPLSTGSTAQFGTFRTKHGTRQCTPSTAMVSTPATYFC